MDRRQEIRAQQESASGLARILLRREQPTARHRQGKLFHERGWPADAGPQGPAAAGSAILQSSAEVTAGGGAPFAEILSSSREPGGTPRRSHASHVLPPLPHPPPTP